MKLVAVYSARDAAQAHLLASLLKSSGIAAVLSGETLASLGGYALTGIQVLIHPDQQPQAKPIVEQFIRSASAGFTPRSASPWRCPGCGEMIEPQFTDCWNCQTSRPGGDESVAAETEIPRPPPDPQIPIDVTCLKCQYNLRTLSIEGCCPECGHPIFPSVLAKVRSIEALADDTSPSSDVLRPCLDWFEGRLGFPIEAIGFLEHVWNRALAAAPSAGIDPSQLDYDSLTAALVDLASDFLGDPLTARRALERWNIRTSADLQRLIDALIELRVLALH